MPVVARHRRSVSARALSAGRLPPEPHAATATGSRRAALFAAALACVAVAFGRSGAVDPRAALAVLAFALLFAAAALGLALAAAVAIWRTGYRGIGRALAGAALAVLVLAYPAYLAAKAARSPPLDDVSTDPATPPAFSTSPAARAARGGSDHPDPSPDEREAARRAYPNLQAVTLDLPGDAAYDLVVRTVAARGWRIVEAVPPRGKFGTGHVDAVATGGVMGLPDDVAIRVRPLSGETRVDIRSASRLGRMGLGVDAARVQSLADELGDADS